MTSRKDQADRMRMPGEEPTDDDLRVDAELTRQELAETVAALSDKADVKTRVQRATKERVEAVQAGGTQLVSKLPDPVAEKIQPVWTSVSRRPAIPLGGLAALLATLLVWLKIRRR
jgi:hypothetical protein